MRLERRTILFTFLVIIVLTFVAGLLVILGWFPKADPQFGRWIYGVLLVEILGAVVGFVRYRPGAESMLVNIAFPEGAEPQSVEFDDEIIEGIKRAYPRIAVGVDGCVLEAKEEMRERKARRTQ